ncbi:hypothetical protein AAFF_G00138440 [Aldrovandia affinis]|uniref:Uncharacterized protein n=1 Tax=Aldrovandia affinis TaxID=143900 RepID=A0AAD7TC21_9TELE|nr:hypothetical protein AAFF_G00138440 [Aldrovandia affinis]
MSTVTTGVKAQLANGGVRRPTGKRLVFSQSFLSVPLYHREGGGQTGVQLCGSYSIQKHLLQRRVGSECRAQVSQPRRNSRGWRRGTHLIHYLLGAVELEAGDPSP